MLPALSTALCRGGMMEALLPLDTSPLLLSCVTLACCCSAPTDLAETADNTVATRRDRSAAAAHVESDSLRDTGRPISAIEIEQEKCRTAAAPALLPLCRWLLHHWILTYALCVCDCIMRIATAAASGSDGGSSLPPSRLGTSQSWTRLSICSSILIQRGKLPLC